MNRFGWWDIVAGPPTEMVNRFTAERVVMVSPLALGDRPDQNPHWQRFEYRHDTLRFPLAISWDLADREIVVDYNCSAGLWRRETNAREAVPPYETFVRIDDCVIDALLCWPGVADALRRPYRRSFDKVAGGQLRRVGGYLDGDWQERLCVLELMRARKRDRFVPLDIQQPLTLGRFTTAARKWTYSEVPGGGLSEAEEQVRTAHTYALQDMMLGPWTLRKFAEVSRTGRLPQVRSSDGAGLMYPVSVQAISWGQGQVPLSQALFGLHDARHGTVGLIRSEPVYFRMHNARALWLMTMRPTGNVTPEWTSINFRYVNQMRADGDKDPSHVLLTGDAYRFWARNATEAAMAWGKGISTEITRTVVQPLPDVRHEALWPKETPELSRDLACRPAEDVALHLQMRGGVLSPEVIHRVAGVLDVGGETLRAFDTYANHLISEHFPE